VSNFVSQSRSVGAQDAVGGILTDTAEIDLNYDDGANQITAAIVAGSIDETKLDTSVNASLDLADSAVQEDDDVSLGAITSTGSGDRLYSLVHDRAVTNLAPNPSFEVDTTGWTTFGANGGIARSTADAYTGSACLNITSTGGFSMGGQSTAISISSNTRYIISLYAKNNASGTEGFSLRASGDVSGNSAAASGLADEDDWGRLQLIWTSGASDTTVQIQVYAASGVADFFIDAVMLEEKTTGEFASRYVDGDQGLGYAWTGTPHNSTSTRVSGLTNNGTPTGEYNGLALFQDGSLDGTGIPGS
jgi:hypothetical protein